MDHLEYYRYQTTARGIRSLADVQRDARGKAYLYSRIVRPWLPADLEAPIAELACGHGSFLCWLTELGFTRLSGCDGSVEQIAMARLVTGAVELADVNEWLGQQAENSLAVVAGIDVIEHISKDNFMELLKRSHRALKPGGRLILRFPNGESPLVGMNLFNDITHVWTYTPNCIDTLARMHGYRRILFNDEGSHAIRDHRWLKVPLGHLSTAVLRFLFRAATRETVTWFSPHLWASVEK
jgi:SAM-dependent methyltransferase